MNSDCEKDGKTFGSTPVKVGELARRAVRREPSAPTPTASAAPPGIVVLPEYEEIRRLAESGCPAIFATGNAGTGKTCLVHYLRENLAMPLAVVAPTGVAAINVQGMTIHSLFRFPPRIVERDDIRKLPDRKLFRKLQLLIIDEISMVRADVLDGIDKFLRKNRECDTPFGGVQLLLIGDLFQLPPVVPPREWTVLKRKGYESPYFFSAFGLGKLSITPVGMNTVFRQDEREFIGLLDRVRVGGNVPEVVVELNSKCCGRLPEEASATTLTCTNRQADLINTGRLNLLDPPECEYRGLIKGRFNLAEDKLPSPLDLKLRKGARVMFTKNDPQKRWINGTVGVVEELAENSIRATVDEGGRRETCDILPVSWENFKYQYDAGADKIVAQRVGEYIQYPLMPAWAVTIHKSQGRTLDSVLIDFGHGAFACGQAYVALSRCRKLEGLRLKNPLRDTDIICDPAIQRFYQALAEMSG